MTSKGKIHQVPDTWGKEPSFADRFPHQFPAMFSFSTRWFLPTCVFEFFLQIWYIGGMEDVLEKRIGTPDFLTGKNEMKMKLNMRTEEIPFRFFYSPNFGGIRAQPGE